MNLKLYFKSIVVLISLVISVGCFSASNKVFHRGNYDEPDTLDPQQAFAVPDYNILHDLYEGLTTFDKDGNVILGQANRYDVSKDKKTYKFYLKDNLKWSNGDKLTAYDFEYGIKRTLDPNVNSQNHNLLKSFKNYDAILQNKLSFDSLGVKALDNKTLEISLEHPIPYLLDLLTHNTFMPYYVKSKLNNATNVTNITNIANVTNGPFVLKKWVVNSHLSLMKNPYFRQADTVLLDKVVYYPINQPSAELKRYRAGGLDYTAKIPIESIDWINSHLRGELYGQPMLAAYYYVFNVTKPPFNNNKFLRQALSLAIDKDIIANKILKANRTPADRFVPIYMTQLDNQDRDIQKQQNKELRLLKSRELYNQAGYNDDNKLKVKLLYHTNEANKLIASAVASMWKKNLGVETELINQEWKVYLKTRLEREQTQVFREGWVASYNDPTAFLDLFMCNNPQNSSGYCNRNYDNLIKRASYEQNKNAREMMLLKAEDILLEDAPVLPVYNPQSYHLIKPYIGGATVNNYDVTLSRYVYFRDDRKL